MQAAPAEVSPNPFRPVGFDLDMTLIDSRPAIMASFACVAAETGVRIDPAAVDRRLGIKLEDELAYWFPAAEIDAAVRIYRTHYRTLAVPLTSLLPGARESLAAVRASGARAVVITAKHVLPARQSLDAFGLAPDELFPDAHGPQKATVLSGISAAVYVGDTPADMNAAVAAGAYPLGVATGSFSAVELRAAGASTVLASLAEFPVLYAEWMAKRR
jgi:phosphoglycolate phosphatase